MDKKKIGILAILLFLIIGLGTFVFANPDNQENFKDSEPKAGEEVDSEADGDKDTSEEENNGASDSEKDLGRWGEYVGCPAGVLQRTEYGQRLCGDPGRKLHRLEPHILCDGAPLYQRSAGTVLPAGNADWQLELFPGVRRRRLPLL